jgi:cysteine desulfurase
VKGAFTQREVYFHTDAAQTFGKLGIDVKEISIDMLMAGSHKMYGPKGAACLYLKKGTRIELILHGGGHEKGLRASTVNIPAIVGFAEATKICMEEIEAEGRRTMVLRDKLIDGALKIENSTLNGHPSQRLPNNTNFSFSFVKGESMVMSLDSYGISASTGSACSSEKLEPSYVLLSTGLPLQLAHSSLRLSLGRWTDEEDVDYVLEVLPEVIERLRKISPFRSRSG